MLLGISLLLYITALATPALDVGPAGRPDALSGIQVLLIGWAGLFVAQFAWYANFFLILAVIPFLFRLWITTACVLLVGLLIALHTFALYGRELPADEGGVNKMHLHSIAIGTWFWLASFIVPLLGSLLLRLAAKRPKAT